MINTPLIILEHHTGRLAALREEYTRIGRSTEPADLEACKEAAAEIYSAARWPVPPITLVGSPAEFGRRHFDRQFSQVYSLSWKQLFNVVRGETQPQIGSRLLGEIEEKVGVWIDRRFLPLRAEIERELGTAEKGMVSFAGSCGPGMPATYRFLVEVGCQIHPQHQKLLEAFDLLCRSSLWWWPMDKTVLVLDRPAEVHLSPRGESGEWMLHNSKGPALRFRDATVGDPSILFALHNVRVPPWLVLTPPERLKAADIVGLENAEQRREGVRLVGVERLIQELGAKVLDREGDYELLLLELPTDRSTGWGVRRPRPYLKMRNPSLGVWHVEGVHPDCKTVKEALTWRNQTDKRPEIVT